MPRRRATARASATVSGEQQLPNLRAASSGSCQGQTRSVTPTTSWPCSTSSAAATDESTPPLIPTTMRSAMLTRKLARSLARRRDQLAEPVELLARGIRDLDPARALVADDAHARGERDAQRVLDRGELGGAPQRPAGRLYALGLHPLLGRAHRPRVRENLLAKLQLIGRGVEREQRTRMAHREATCAQIGLDRLGQLQKTQAVRDAAAVARDSLGQLFLRPPEFGEQALVGLRLFHRIEVFAEQVLHQGELEGLGVGRFPDDGRNFHYSSHLCCSPTPLADDQLVALAESPDDHRLQHAALLQRLG